MLQRLIELKAQVITILSDVNKQKGKQLESIYLTPSEWILINEIKCVLEPFQIVLEALSGSNYPTLAKAYNALKALYVYLELGNVFDSFNMGVMKQLLLAYLTHYFPRNDNNEQYCLMRAAAYVDPPEHLSLDNDELEKAEVYIKSLYDRLTLTLHDETSSNTAQQQKPGADEIKEEGLDTKNNHLSIYELFLRRTGIRTKVVNGEENISLEFDRYKRMLNMLTKPRYNTFWKDNTCLKRLRSMTKVLLAIPGTSVPSESCFSISDNFVRK
ncbi:unnamed protein product [Didymodactylos carnosus]|uniref:HAT C-terminal dimerisation domain-containing protein n=1 Tax=Didymodactylos carnosus TaxID=1234261 RepID=A0A815GP94_9BILA|nr:unnamed protein product [Didymodactylos carnosus]CAF1342837.1 unnamed protein product [Didymodactylos carnosus]CAF4007249.1 unnamed protein product [Didymodactylos carnosus]CAF4205615.1 unnamed protein product [Didymodactylos carnosus]